MKKSQNERFVSIRSQKTHLNKSFFFFEKSRQLTEVVPDK